MYIYLSQSRSVLRLLRMSRYSSACRLRGCYTQLCTLHHWFWTILGASISTYIFPTYKILRLIFAQACNIIHSYPTSRLWIHCSSCGPHSSSPTITSGHKSTSTMVPCSTQQGNQSLRIDETNSERNTQDCHGKRQ